VQLTSLTLTTTGRVCCAPLRIMANATLTLLAYWGIAGSGVREGVVMSTAETIVVVWLLLSLVVLLVWLRVGYAG
jgi:hypothetical protein